MGGPASFLNSSSYSLDGLVCLQRLVGNEVRTRRTCHVLWLREQPGPRAYVRLLLSLRHGSTDAKIALLEKVPDGFSDGTHLFLLVGRSSVLITNSVPIIQVQFVAIFTHSFQLFFRSCDFPKAFGLWIGAHGILFWILFSNFYKSAYLQPEAYKQNRHRISCHSNGQANRDINNNVGNDLTSSVKKAA